MRRIKRELAKERERLARWAEEAMEWRARAEECEGELYYYKAAMDVKLAGDGLIEYRGKLYKRIDDPALGTQAEPMYGR